MGMPVISVKTFEEHVKYSYEKNMAIVIMANAYSDSKAVELIHRNFHLMDRVSDDVFFYLPGYFSNGYRMDLYNPSYNDSWMRRCEEEEFADSHATNINTAFINSPRLGKISFNEISFADFVMEFTNRIPGYFYVDMCQMILIPINSNRELEYKNAKVYDLDRITREPGGPSLDSFLFYAFKIFRGERLRQTPLLDKLLGRNRNVFNDIDELYKESITTRYHEDRYEIVIHDIIFDMECLLQWSLKEDFYFISYSSQNVMQAEMLKMLMQANGLKVWIAPDGIPQGRSYSQAVPTALMFAKHFILILTEDAANSRWVMRELDVAINNEENTKVKILLTNNFTINDLRANNQLRFYLNTVQIRYNFEDVIYDDNIFKEFVR